MNKLLSFLHQSKEIKNAGWIVAEQLLQMLISMIVSILSARYLGPSNYGALTYTASFVSFATSVATLGLEGVVIKKMVERPEDEGVLLGSSFVFRIVSSVFSVVSVVTIVTVLNADDPIKRYLVFLQSLQLLIRSIFVLDCWFQKYLKSKYVSLGKSVAAIIVAGYKVWLLATSKSIIWFAATSTLYDAIIAVFLVAFYRKERGPQLRVERKVGMEVLAESYHFILSGLMSAAYGQMDRIMIGNMLSDSDVGLYNIATTISGTWLVVPIAIINSFRPKILKLKTDNSENYELRLEQLYSCVIWLCIIVSVMICVLARFLVGFLYGEEYILATQTLRLTIWCETFAMIGTARGIWVLCEKKNKYVKYYLGIGTAVNLILNSTLIPVWGINGAAVATLITQIITSIVSPLFFKETRYHTVIVARAFVCHWFFSGRQKRRLTGYKNDNCN